MSFLIRFLFTTAGEVVHDETVVGDLAALDAIEKDVFILGQRGTLRLEFDPPLVAEIAPLDEQATS